LGVLETAQALEALEALSLQANDLALLEEY